MLITKFAGKRLHQAGDTIIEVLIVLAVLGLAVSISFATANRSLLSTRGAEQDSEATEQLQSQLESLRYMASTLNPATPAAMNPFLSAGPYCVNDNSIVLASDTGDYTADCENVDNLYTISVIYSAANNDLFTLTATWTDIQGQGTDSATLVYRMHQ